MKKKIIVAAIMAMMTAVSVPAFAQGKHHKKKTHCKARTEQCAARQTDRGEECAVRTEDCKLRATCRGGFESSMLDGITLTEEQKAKFDARVKKQKAEIDKDRRERREKMAKRAEKQRVKADKEREKRQKKFDKRIEKMDKDMKEILTPEQYGVYRQNVEKMRVERKNRVYSHKRDGKGAKRDGKGKKNGRSGRNSGQGTSAPRPGSSQLAK